MASVASVWAPQRASGVWRACARACGHGEGLLGWCASGATRMAAVAPRRQQSGISIAGVSVVGAAVPGGVDEKTLGPLPDAAQTRPIYLDMQATTPTDPRVLDAMMPAYVSHYGNPHSRTHSYGWDSEASVERARSEVAALINAEPKEIIFTSGATEANNMAVKGVARFYSGKKRHVITCQTEHKCVLDSCRQLQQQGFDVTYLPVKSDGLIELSALEAALRDDTALVSLMMVNNEIGVIQPIEEAAALCKARGVFFHTDAAQAVGKIPVDVKALGVDLMSISGHKLYGPKGIGAIYVRRRPRVRLEPIINGGGQERGLRSGTLPTALCVGLGAAARIASQEMENDLRHVAALGERLMQGIIQKIPHVQLNGSHDKRYPGNVNVSFAFVEGESLLMALKNVAVSSGSACTSASLEPSYVLRALGVDEDMAHTSIRFGLGRFSTEKEVDYAIELAVEHVTRLREMSPLWEMVQDGIDIKSINWVQEH
ncbi:Cysteine desulfurase, mitochondrial [Porphyridium purpureum]|uniref:cysteine desulfurase n=1 Tax=Porphyridium purpureum TaxID=35688 RepID=A0A5J4ZA80_PORPP|nr:Cysteine desulfurase, mitochondrial [Porphyridium purpureum]|eukprot:POR8184..scf295_1